MIDYLRKSTLYNEIIQHGFHSDKSRQENTTKCLNHHEEKEIESAQNSRQKRELKHTPCEPSVLKASHL